MIGRTSALERVGALAAQEVIDPAGLANQGVIPIGAGDHLAKGLVAEAGHQLVVGIFERIAGRPGVAHQQSAVPGDRVGQLEHQVLPRAADAADGLRDVADRDGEGAGGGQRVDSGHVQGNHHPVQRSRLGVEQQLRDGRQGVVGDGLAVQIAAQGFGVIAGGVLNGCVGDADVARRGRIEQAEGFAGQDGAGQRQLHLTARDGDAADRDLGPVAFVGFEGAGAARRDDWAACTVGPEQGFVVIEQDLKAVGAGGGAHQAWRSGVGGA